MIATRANDARADYPATVLQEERGYKRVRDFGWLGASG
jgi:hypothetical protein